MTNDDNSKLTSESLRELLARIRGFSRPVVSLYATVPATDRRAFAVRTKNTLRDLHGVSDALRARLSKYFAEADLLGRSVAVFACADDLEAVVLPTPFDDDETSDRLLSRVGEPYLAPMLATLSRYGSQVVLYTDRDHVRAFRLELGRAEPLFETRREPVADEQDAIGQSKDRFPKGVASVASPNARGPHTAGAQQSKPKHIADRGDAAKQLKDERISASQASLYSSSARLLEAELDDRETIELIIVGPERDRHLMLSCMPPSVSKLVVALLGNENGAVPSESDIASVVRPTLEQLDADRSAQLLDVIAERGIQGFGPCLSALQEGRLHRLVVPHSFEATAYVDPKTEHVSPDADEVAQLSERRPRPIELSTVLPELAEKWGTQIQFIGGDQARRLIDQFDGMAGLSRW